MSKGGYLSHHEYRKLLLLQSTTGRILNVTTETAEYTIEMQISQLREEYNMLYSKLTDLDNRLAILEAKNDSRVVR